MSKPTNPQQLAAEFELYKRIKLLGEGAFGKAYLVEDLQTHQLLVQKQMDMKAMSPEEKRETYKEAKILQQLNHPNIVKFQEVYTTKKGKLCIIMEYADGGDLARVVKDAKGKYLQEKQILDWFTQICLAIKHVHDRKIIHRDLKGQNIFLTKSQMVKLGDFGIARVLSKTVEKAKTMVGTPYYLSPEIIESKPYSQKTDIWSLGVILYELCALKPPFNADSLHFLALKIVKGQFSPIPAHYSREMKNLIQILLQVDPIRRPSINDIMKLPIINERVKNFLSETIRQIEFSHTILHNKKIDAKVNIADIKVVNNESPCPQNLLDEMKKQAQKQEPSPSQQNIQQPGKAQVVPSSVAPGKQVNPIMQYANNYRQGNQDQKPNSAQLAQQQQIIQQQKAQQQEYEKKKELEKLKMVQLEKERMQKEREAYEKLANEKEARIKRERELYEKEQLKKQKERDDLLKQHQALNVQKEQALHQQKPPVAIKREEQGAGGVGVYGNPNFKPQPMKGQPGKPPASAQLNIKKPAVQNNGNNKGTGQRSGSSSARSSSQQQRQQIQKKAEEDKQKAQELRHQRQKSENERKESEARVQKEKDEDRERKKEEQSKKIEQQREQMKQDRDRKKWDKGGAKFEFVQRNGGGSSSQTDLDDATTVASSEQQQKSAQKAPVVEREKPKKWDVKPNQKKGDWNVEIYEPAKKPIPGNNNNNNQKVEQLDEYNSDSETNQQENQKQKINQKQEETNIQQKHDNLDEYNSEDDEEQTKEIVECIDQEDSKLEEVNENTFLRQFERDNLQKNQKKNNNNDIDIQTNDDTTFQMDVDVNDPKFMNYVNDLQNIVADVAEKAENMQIDDKFIRNNAFDFTKTMKTQKKLTPLAPKELSEQKDDDMGEREDDPEELALAGQTGQFLGDFPEPPKLQQKILSKDEEESINVISSGYEGLEELYLRLEQELGDKFKLAYNIMKEELKNLSGLNELEKKYGQSKYRDILNFLSDEEIEKYLRLILTLIVLEEKLLDLNAA